MNINLIKALLSFVWLLPFLYMFLDIYIVLNITISNGVFYFLIIESFVAACLLLIIWAKEFLEISKIRRAFKYLKEENLAKLDSVLNRSNMKLYCENGRTLMRYALDNQLSPRTIQYLISQKLTIDYTEDPNQDLGSTLFHMCAYYNHIDDEIIKQMLSLKAPINFVDETKGFKGLSTLQTLVLRAHKLGIITLINNGADLNYFMNDLSLSTLMIATKYVGEPVIVKILLKAGADVNMVNKDGYTALLFAVQYNPNPAVITTLVNSGANIGTYMIKANILGQQNEVTPLMLASMHNNADVVKQLIVLGDNKVDFKDSFGMSILIMAASSNTDVEVFKTLISNGASLDKARDSEGNTPLMAAAYLNSNPNVIRYMIERTHNLSHKNRDGFDFVDYLKQNQYLSDNEKQTIITRWL